MTYTELPERGVVFWPVGTGDSTTVVVDAEHVLQVDLRDMAAADEDGAVVAPVIDRLAETLRTRDDRPYLAGFALTHADKDHCLGFGDLLDSDILVGEIWATPRLWREYLDDDADELCEDAKRFQAEAERRVAATLAAVKAGREPASGDRIRIIGSDVDRDDHAYAELPRRYFTYPGEAITTLDGEEVGEVFEAFVHAPFKDDCAAARNETSLAMQLTLRDPDTETEGWVLLFGDLAYATIRKIFDYSAPERPERLTWNVMLSAHHCSKRAMYTPSPTGGEEELHDDLLEDFAKYATEGARVVASSLPIPPSDKPMANPPHAKAKARYEEIVDEPVLCTGEYPTEEDPRPIVFGLVPGEGLVLLPVEDLEADRTAERAAGRGPRGGDGARLLKVLGLTAAAVAGGLAAARAARARDARARDTGEPGAQGSGLDRAQQAVERARGAGSAPVTPVGFGRC